MSALLEAGCDVDKARTDGATPLYIAAEKGHGEVVAALITNGCVMNKVEVDGRTLFYMTAYFGYAEVVEALIRVGWIVEGEWDNGSARDNVAHSMYVAAQEGHLKVVEALLKAGCDMDKSFGTTPLWVAARHGGTEAVEVLLKEHLHLQQRKMLALASGLHCTGGWAQSRSCSGWMMIYSR